MEEICEAYDDPRKAQLVVIGNKNDLEDERVISEEDGRKLVEKYKETFRGKIEVFWGGEVSAKTGDGVLKCFQDSVERYLMGKEGCPICDYNDRMSNIDKS